MEECPVFICETSIYGDIKYLEPFFGFTYQEDKYVSQKQKTKRFISLNDISQANTVGGKNYSDPKFIRRFIKESENISDEIQTISEKMKNCDFTRKSDKELLAIYLDYFEKFSKMIAFYHALRPEMVSLLEESIMQDILLKCPEDNAEELYAALLSMKLSRKEILSNFGLKEELSDDSFAYADIIHFLGKRRLAMHSIWMRSLQHKENLFEEIGRRIGLTGTEVANCLKEEIMIALSPIDERKIKSRLEQYQYQMEDGKGILYHKIIHKDDDIKYVYEFSGLCASPGKAKGKVKIIRRRFTGPYVEDMESMQRGDVLVTGNTDPNMIVAIKKASAIVTDEGGMLSHAAIISREFGIPCVVGTKIATKILKDGDIVYVDAKKGLVKKL